MSDSWIVKCVTDYADGEKGDGVREWATVASARFFYLMLARWLDDRGAAGTDGGEYWAQMTSSGQ